MGGTGVAPLLAATGARHPVPGLSLRTRRPVPERALSLSALLVLSFAAYAFVVAPLVASASPRVDDPRTAGLAIAAIVAVALLHPPAQRGAQWFIDRGVLRRASTEDVMAAIGTIAESHSSIERVLDEACVALAPALSAREVLWWSEHRHGPTTCGQLEVPPDSLQALTAERASEHWATSTTRGVVALGPRLTSAVAVLPLAEAPRYALVVNGLTGGRRLLSDDVQVLERASAPLARRGDALRLQLERFGRQLHEEEASRLAAEAELRALRDQLNPHFLLTRSRRLAFSSRVRRPGPSRRCCASPNCSVASRRPTST